MVRPASYPPPCYVGCFCGRSTKTPWKTKAKPSSIRSVADRAAKDYVSVDQLDSPTLWFVTQMKVQSTKAWYQVATVFVDHHSRLSYLNLSQSKTSKELVKGKLAFEAYACDYRVKIKHYHAYNGRFADNSFRETV